MKNICIIPARGGSKRIPDKNIVDFCGRALLSYTIEAAKKSKLFGKEIYLSSDSSKILTIADRYQIKKIQRPKNISGDRATLEQAALHLLNNINQEFDNLCMLLPSSPLRNASDIRKSYKILNNTTNQAVMSVVSYHWLYPFWALQEKNGYISFFDRKYLIDSKKLPKNIYCPTGAVRWVKITNFLKEKKFYSKALAKYEIPFKRSVDIDTFEDLELAKKFYKLKPLKKETH